MRSDIATDATRQGVFMQDEHTTCALDAFFHTLTIQWTQRQKIYDVEFPLLLFSELGRPMHTHSVRDDTRFTASHHLTRFADWCRVISGRDIACSAAIQCFVLKVHDRIWIFKCCEQ